jgi:hypothetical protein
MGQEIELRACCGKLRWALLDVIEPLPGGTRISGLRWGPEVVPLNLETDSAAAPEVVDTILEEAEQWLGSSTSCYTGRGALVIGSDEDADARHRR